MTDEERRKHLDIAVKELLVAIEKTKVYKTAIKILDWLECKLETITKH